MKITLGGLGGTGTSSTGKMVAKKLGYSFISGGAMFREVAAEKGMTMEEFDIYTKENPREAVDYTIDNKLKEYGQNNGNFVMEAKMAWYCVPDSFKIILTADANERARRIAGDDSKDRNVEKYDDVEQTKERMLNRNEVHRLRIKEMYDIENLFSEEHFDLAINTTDMSLDEVVNQILEEVKRS